MADAGNRMYCHSCDGVWSQNGSGLTCPHCHSEFTEIVEIPPDPDTPPPEHHRAPPSPPINPWADHNPWASEETPERRLFGDMETGPTDYAHRTYRSPDGRFTFSSTTINGGGGYSSSRQSTVNGNPILPMMLQSFDTLLREMSDIHDPPPHRRSPGLDDPFDPHTPGWFGMDRHADPEGLRPRNPDRAQSMSPPLGSLAELLESFQDPEAQRRPRRHGARGVAGPNPLAMLSALLNMNRNGDAVYSQEELDRVISEMIDHTAPGGTAPPPATSSAIRSLPKKKIDREMLGTDGKAECSICMETVELGTEVTVLPCTHWFHFNCIEMWLSQHNACPHCRRSIDSVGGVAGSAEGTSENPVVIQDSPEAPVSGRQRRRSSPFSFRSARSSGSHSSPGSPTPESSESTRRNSRGSRGSRNSRGSRGERGGISGWVWSRFGGGSE